MTRTIEEVREINKPVNTRTQRKNFKHIKPPTPEVGWYQIDLADFSDIYRKKGNKSFKYAFVLIDLYSRYLFVVPLKSKKAEDVLEAFKQLGLKKLKGIFADGGLEFTGVFKKYLNKLNIPISISQVGDHHRQGIVERVIKTLREKIRVYWIQNDNYDWISPLGKIVEIYNKTRHHTIKTTPSKAYKGLIIPTQKYNDKYDNLKNGDNVRYLLKKRIFDKKSGTQNYSTNVYSIEERIGNKYKLNNGPSNYLYSRWELIRSKFTPTTDIQKEPINKQREIVAKKRDKKKLQKLDINPKNIIRKKVR
jgi:hypothetical protein